MSLLKNGICRNCTHLSYCAIHTETSSRQERGPEHFHYEITQENTILHNILYNIYAMDISQAAQKQHIAQLRPMTMRGCAEEGRTTAAVLPTKQGYTAGVTLIVKPVTALATVNCIVAV
jgi:hypothetical protein